MKNPIPVVINPKASRYKNAKKLAKGLALHATPRFRVITAANIKATKSELKSAIKKGAKYVVIHGGDGTMYHALNALAEVYSATRKEWPVTIVVVGAGATNAMANCVTKPGPITYFFFKILAQGRDVLHEDAWINLMRIQMTDSKGKKQQVVGTIAHVAGLFNRFFLLFFDSQRTILQNIVKALRLAFKQSSRTPGRKPTTEDSLFEPFPADVEADKRLLDYTGYSMLNVTSIPARIAHLLRFFVQIPPDKIRLVAGRVSPLEIFKNIPRILLAHKMKGKSGKEHDVDACEVSAADGNLLTPVIDGEIFHEIKHIKFSRGPRVRMISLAEFVRQNPELMPVKTEKRG